MEEKQNNVRKATTKRKFKEGDEVLIKKEMRNKDQGRYEGPYKVIGMNHERSYRLQNEKGAVLTRNIEKIKDFKKRGM